jgi:undecaprenyl-diphosphatase
VPEWIKVALLGIIEGITEFLPVSSTGHLLLAEKFLGDRGDLFVTVIQCGAVLAVLMAFWGRMRELVFKAHERENRDYLLKLGAAFFITGIGGLVLKKLEFQLPTIGGAGRVGHADRRGSHPGRRSVADG